MKHFTLFFSLLLSLSVFSLDAAERKEVFSPDKKLHFSLDINNNGALTYFIKYNDESIVLPSTLGLNNWESNFTLEDIVFSENDSFWKPVYGERSQVHDNYNQVVFRLFRNNNDRFEMQLEVRAYNEGIAFRYSFPEHPEGGRDITISEDKTEFRMPVGTEAWFTPRAQAEYSRLPLQDWPGESERPLVLQLKNGLFSCLMEAEMVDFSRTKFILHPSQSNTISCSMYDKVDLTTPFSTPWRVVMVAESAGKLIENNDLILNLNPTSQIANTSWIKPGKVMREISLSAEGAKDLVDFAVKRNLQYIHFDAGWYGYEYVVASDATTVTVDPKRNPNSNLDLQEAIRYANEKGIGVILYVNQRALYKQLDEILPLFKKWGVRGIKFGFVHVGSHRWTTWMHDAVKKCAEYNMMVDIHDEYRPTGFSRTWPNLMTQEGILGNEAMPDANHNTILPFTRFIAGAADYTICYYHRPEFKESLRGGPSKKGLKTTSAHQLALSVIYYSPLQYMYWYDSPSDSQDEPELEFFDAISTVWDDTKVLHGEIGEYITIARRKGEDWFLGTITNNNGRNIKLSFDFLPEGRKYEAAIYFDDQSVNTRTKVGIKRIRVDAKSILDTRLIASGGQAIWIRPL